MEQDTITIKEINDTSPIELLKFIDNKGFYERFYEHDIEFDNDKKPLLKRGKFLPHLLSRYYQRCYNPQTMVDDEGNGEIWYWDWDNKVFKSGGEDFFKEITKRIWGDYFINGISENTIYDIKPSTRISRDKFVLQPEYLPLKNVTLKWIIDNNKYKLVEVEDNYNLFITNRIPVIYNPSIVNTEWKEYIDKHFHENNISLLQEYSGTILWLKSTRIGLVLVGTSNSSKSTFGEVIKRVIGDTNVISVSFQSFVDTYERYRVYKKMLNFVDEMPDMRLKESAYIKTIIAGATTSARTLNKPSIQIQPFIKSIVCTNTLPVCKDDTESWWNKFQVIVVDKQKYDENNPARIFNYHEKLIDTEDKKSGILNWLIEGLQNFLNNGKFTNLMKWEDTRELWVTHTDPIERFFNEDTGYIEYGNDYTLYYVSKENLYIEYTQYCKDKGVSIVSKDSFYKQITYRYVKPRDNEPKFNVSRLGTNDRVYSYVGIRIKNPAPFEDVN